MTIKKPTEQIEKKISSSSTKILEKHQFLPNFENYHFFKTNKQKTNKNRIKVMKYTGKAKHKNDYAILF